MPEDSSTPMFRINKEYSRVIGDISEMARTIVKYIIEGADRTKEKIDKDFLYGLCIKALKNIETAEKTQKTICDKVTANDCIIAFECLMSKVEATKGVSTRYIDKQIELVMDLIVECKNLNPEALLATNPEWTNIEEELKLAVENFLIREAETAKTLRIILGKEPLLEFSVKSAILPILIVVGCIVISCFCLHHMENNAEENVMRRD